MVPSPAAMNVLFLSPAFPPNLRHFCERLAANGVVALGLGDSPGHDVPVSLAGALREYVFLPSLTDEDAVYRAAAGLISRHGRLDRIESVSEHWLDTAARLRDDFRVPGPSADTVARHRRKSGMAGIFEDASIPSIPGTLATSIEAVRAFSARCGYPIVLKPDTGAGAARTFSVADDAALAVAFREDLGGHLAQPFIEGDIVTYDGLVDADGRIVYVTSHRYDTGIMQVVSGALDGHYYSLRAIPPELDAVGRRAVAAFELRSQLFHLEFFETPRGYVALEMNLRAPGGFTTDMMNHGSDIDVYDLWAKVVAGHSLERFTYERKYHTGHAGRRDGRDYRLSEDEVSRQLGATVVQRRRLPRELATMQGDVMFLLRSPDLAELRRGIALVQERA